MSASLGVPVTVVASLIVTVRVTTSPAFSLPLAAPVALVMATALMVGAKVSLATGVPEEELLPPLPAAAANPSAPRANNTPEADAAPAAAAPAPAVAALAPAPAPAPASAAADAACGTAASAAVACAN